MKKQNGRSAKVRSFSATDEDMAMLEAVAAYHGFTKSGTLVGPVPAGNRLAHGARVKT